MINRKNALLAAVPAALLASQALAGAPVTTILSFGYTDLNGVYTRTGTSGAGFGEGLMTADAVDVVLGGGTELRSSGDVTRLSSPNGTATFDTGFVSGADVANFHIELSILNNDGDFADGAGSFTITDLDGDTITGNIAGTWIRGGLNQTFFNGDLTSVVLTDNGMADGLFNGNSGSFDLNLGFPGIFEGALVQLFLRPGAGFFDASFSEVSTQVSGEIVPTPGAVALIGLAGAAGLRRRRR
ncbi:MAG: MYXO-CTERM sorting domain-containing protein [Phycisphaerales bacterium]